MKKLGNLIFVLSLLLAGPATAALWQWSLTPATNGTADPTINWAVGMAPSAVDPSARAMMSRVAEYRDDISGALVTGGSSTAYTVTTNQATGGNGICPTSTVPTDGTMIAITPNATNGTSATLGVDSCTAAPIQQSAGVAALPGTLVSGTPYTLKYSVSNTAWMLRDFFGGNPYLIPLGGLMPYTLATAPNSNFVLPAGQCLSTTTYAVYWVALGSPVPGSCSAGQFQIIDLRGRVPVALDNLNGSAAGRLTSAATGCGTAMTSIGAACTATESMTLLTTNLPPYTPSGSVTTSSTATFAFTNAGYSSAGGAGGSSTFILNSASSQTVVGTGALAGTAQGGASTAFPRVQPTIAVGYLLRVI